jgi:hypothetical protein
MCSNQALPKIVEIFEVLDALCVTISPHTKTTILLDPPLPSVPHSFKSFFSESTARLAKSKPCPSPLSCSRSSWHFRCWGLRRWRSRRCRGREPCANARNLGGRHHPFPVCAQALYGHERGGAGSFLSVRVINKVGGWQELDTLPELAKHPWLPQPYFC